MIASLHAPMDLICVGYFVKPYRIFFILLVKRLIKFLKNLIGIGDPVSHIPMLVPMYSTSTQRASIVPLEKR